MIPKKLLPREKTSKVLVGNVELGGGSPISVQSMAKAFTTDIDAVLAQCESVHRAGGDIMRVSVPDVTAATALKRIIANSPIPIIADIHFDYRLALAALEAGVHKLRINPGNIGSSENVKIVAKEAKTRNVPIRIGVNAGSMPKDILQKYGKLCPQAMVDAAKREIFTILETGFDKIVVSLKSSSPALTIESNKLFAKKFKYPLHLGVTEAGFGMQGIIASTIGLAPLLSAGIGDTIRISLTEPPEKEVIVGREILRFLELRKYGPRVISCPTCGRTEVDVSAIARDVWDRIKKLDCDITMAVMGCVVNGPGEAREADIGVACGPGAGLIFSKGEQVRKVSEDEIVDALVDEVGKIDGE